MYGLQGGDGGDGENQPAPSLGGGTKLCTSHATANYTMAMSGIP